MLIQNKVYDFYYYVELYILLGNQSLIPMKKQVTPPKAVRKKNVSLHFAVGLLLSLTLVTMAFEWNFRNELTDNPIDLRPPKEIDKPDMKAVVLPTPPRPKVPQHITTVPDDTPLAPEKKEEEPKKEPLVNDEPTLGIEDILDGDPPTDPAPTMEDYDIIPAEPVGGMDKFYSYLNKNIRYPQHLTGRNISGKVFVAFEIDKSGKISKVEILKGFDARLEKEIIRVLKNAPDWIPAQQGRWTVETRLTIPFSFSIQ